MTAVLPESPNAATRRLLADACTEVDGITGHPYYVQTTEPGAALVWLDHTDYPYPADGVVSWEIRVVLPQDLAAAERHAEEILPRLLEALAPHLRITTVRPVTNLDLPGVGVFPLAVITGYREE